MVISHKYLGRNSSEPPRARCLVNGHCMALNWRLYHTTSYTLYFTHTLRLGKTMNLNLEIFTIFMNYTEFKQNVFKCTVIYCLSQQFICMHLPGIHRNHNVRSSARCITCTCTWSLQYMQCQKNLLPSAVQSPRPKCWPARGVKKQLEDTIYKSLEVHMAPSTKINEFWQQYKQNS